MRTDVARILITCAFAIVAGGCGMFANRVELDTSEPEWTRGPGAPGPVVAWNDDDTSVSVSARFEPCELPVTVRVTNHYGGALVVALERRAESGTDSNLGTWSIDGAEDPPQSLASGMEMTVPGPTPEGRRSTAVLRLPADRAWTTEEPVRTGDTISYDICLNRDGARSIRALRIEVGYVGTGFHWWTPLVLGAAGALAIYEPSIFLSSFGTTGF